MTEPMDQREDVYAVEKQRLIRERDDARKLSEERFIEIERARRIIAELVAYKESHEKFVRDMLSLINAMQEK